MDHPIPGDLYTVRNTPRNRMNGLRTGAECRIAHADAAYVSITVTKGEPYLNLRIPRNAFGENFAEVKGANIIRSYVQNQPFPTLYR